MATQPSSDLQKALEQTNALPVRVEHPVTHEAYFIYSEDLHVRATQALAEQEDLASIRRGVEQMQAGQGRPLREADADMREQLRFPPRP
jgi:hypothetical protein